MKKKAARPNVDFLPDADEIEQRPLPAFARITLPLLTAALILAVLWASFSQVDLVVSARGRLINPLPNIVVQPLETAIIKTIPVKVGQIVRKGELLATLDATFAKADEEQLRAKLRSLETQTAALTSELAGTPGAAAGGDDDSKLQSRLAIERKANFDAQVRRINENVERLRASLLTNRRDQAVLEARLKSVREIETMQEKLVAQNYGARIRVLEAQDKRLEVERDQLLTKNREQEIERELAALLAEKAAFGNTWRQRAMEDMLGIGRERDSLREQLNKADRRNAMISLVAPQDAVVLEIAKLSPGSIVREAETFFTLVPLGSALEAEVQIDSIDVGYIRPGHFAQVKLDAFPYQKHGGLKGTVRTISGDAFKRDVNSGDGLDAYYLARVALTTTELKKMSPHSRLLPGMTMKAEIVVGKRTVMSYILWPLMKSMDESIREP